MLESKYLKDNIQNIQKLLTIPALRHFETSNLGKLLRLSKIREYKDGELIIEEGDLDPWLYFLLSGKIRIVKEGKSIATISQKGEIFGEMRIVDSLSRSASVYAAGKTICLLDFLLLLYRIFAEYMSIRLRLTNEALVNAMKIIETNKLKKS
ncbi:MAG: cyclic nucleotide-binding domain-containing protein [Deltaproteobacteria bacterium]|nr:cyclic nucleotide-binding domain-containing protein [Deltaproteobacteria bacterium]